MANDVNPGSGPHAVLRPLTGRRTPPQGRGHRVHHEGVEMLVQIGDHLNKQYDFKG